MDESQWIERAQSAEARLQTCKDQTERLKENYRNVMKTFGAKKRGDGSIDIDFAALVGLLSPEDALELRAAIDARHRISGAAGTKPRMAVSA